MLLTKTYDGIKRNKFKFKQQQTKVIAALVGRRVLFVAALTVAASLLVDAINKCNFV